MISVRRLLLYLLDDWLEKLSYLFVGLIIIFCTTIFEGYWWNSTFSIVYGTLIAAIFIDLALPVKRFFVKLALQMIALVAVTASYIQFKPVDIIPVQLSDRLDILLAYASQLQPFVWIAGLLLLIYVLFGLWVHKQLHVFAFCGAAILLLAIFDSFTPIWLWDEIAWIVFISLLWLIARHMNQLSKNHPDSWRELLEYPVALLLPMVIILSVIMLAGTIMPSISPMLQDPYTLWKQSKGERVSVFLGNKLPDSQSFTLFPTALSVSGYGRDDSQLGGGFNYDYSTMMTVNTTHRSYWRGESKSFYTGTGWLTAEIEEGSLTYSVRTGEPLPETDMRPLAETALVEQHFTIHKEDMPSDLLFGAAPIHQLNGLATKEQAFDAGVPFLTWDPERWILKIWDQTPFSYSLTSEVTILDEEKLRTAASAGTVGNDSIYLQLPDTVTERVKQLALELTASATNDYDRAKQLEQYLKMTFPYKSKPELSKLTGDSEDFVDQFLFELKEGYCDYFSTAMAVMARSLGLPARWVKGFAPGILDDSGFPPDGPYGDEMLDPNGAGLYTVRNADAHSWVEIYFEGYGWISFEPTAGFAFPHSYPGGAVPELPELDIAEPTESDVIVESTPVERSLFIWFAAAAALAAGSVALLFLSRKRISSAWHRYRHGSYTNNDRIVLETNKLLRFCKKRGFSRAEHETLREAVMRWSRSYKWLQNDFVAVIDEFERAKYSSIMFSDEAAEQFARKAKMLANELK